MPKMPLDENGKHKHLTYSKLGNLENIYLIERKYFKF